MCSSDLTTYCRIMLQHDILSHHAATRHTVASCCNTTYCRMMLQHDILSHHAATRHTVASCCNTTYCRIMLQHDTLSHHAATRHTVASCDVAPFARAAARASPSLSLSLSHTHTTGLRRQDGSRMAHRRPAYAHAPSESFGPASIDGLNKLGRGLCVTPSEPRAACKYLSLSSL